jgi:hypothetical protein
MRTQGHGITTPEKEEAFRSFFEGNLNASSLFGHFLHVDLNCGSGWNEDALCLGSPLVFLNAVKRARRADVGAVFVDQDPVACESLRDRLRREVLPPGFAWSVCCQDNRRTLELLLREEEQFGSLVADPNGHGRGKAGNGTDYRLLANVLARHVRMDVAINVNLNLLWQMRGWNRARGADVFKADDQPGIRELIGMMPKEHWHVQFRSPPRGSPGRGFLVLIGRNGVNFKDHAARGIYRVNSPTGQRIIEYAETGRGEHPLGGASQQQFTFA